jgi:hypothetical protein
MSDDALQLLMAILITSLAFVCMLLDRKTNILADRVTALESAIEGQP